jgi:hypothetical protein
MYRRRWRRRKKPKPGVHGPPFPCTVDSRQPEPVVKGSLRRAKLRRALDHRLRSPTKITEKRERGALGHRLSEMSCRATICQRSTGRSSLTADCTTELLFPMCPWTCFEAGRFPQIQSSWTALCCCSRKWMSGHADALAPSSTDPIWQIPANRQPSDLCSLAGNPSDKSEEMCVFP